jgi:hypothetical protein
MIFLVVYIAERTARVTKVHGMAFSATRSWRAPDESPGILPDPTSPQPP